MHYHSVIVMSIGAVRMHRGLADRGALCGHQPGTDDIEEQPIKTAMQFISSSHPSHREEGTHGARGGVFASLSLIMPKVKWFNGKLEDGSAEKELKEAV